MEYLIYFVNFEIWTNCLSYFVNFEQTTYLILLTLKYEQTTYLILLTLNKLPISFSTVKLKLEHNFPSIYP